MLQLYDHLLELLEHYMIKLAVHLQQLVNKPIRKKDAMNLLLGKPAYVEDITPADCLIVKVLRSPHAHALIKEIDISAALALPGIEVRLPAK